MPPPDFDDCVGRNTPLIVKAVMMQKDESILLDPWLKYHGYLFGFENIVVIDNGSTDQTVLQALERFERVGVEVVRGYGTPRDFEAKGVIVGEVIRKWDAGPAYDYALPIDCDESLGLWQDGRLSCRRGEILSYLEALASIKGIHSHFKVVTNLFNIPEDPGWYWPQDATKTFFAPKSIVGLDHGFHFGRTKFDVPTFETHITYFHFHFKPYDDFLISAKNKLMPFVDPDDHAALAHYQGPGGHLLAGILSGRDAYLSRFNDCFRIHFSELGFLLSSLGVDHAMFNESSASCGIPDLALAMTGHNDVRRVNHEVFDAFAYRRKWIDVATAGVDPLLHYVRCGRAENREIS